MNREQFCVCVAALERECVLSRERVRVLQVDLETVCLQLHQKEHTIQELVEKLQHQQVPFLKYCDVLIIFRRIHSLLICF